jgi:ferredoxin-type protein NapH
MAAGAANAPVLWKRSIAQPGFLSGLDEFSVYGIVQCLFAVPKVSCGNCPVLQCPGRDYWLPVRVGLLVSGIAVGRAFCGWACPGGLVREILGKFSLFRCNVQGELAKVLSFGEYPIIAVSLVVGISPGGGHALIPEIRAANVPVLFMPARAHETM